MKKKNRTPSEGATGINSMILHTGGSVPWQGAKTLLLTVNRGRGFLFLFATIISVLLGGKPHNKNITDSVGEDVFLPTESEIIYIVYFFGQE